MLKKLGPAVRGAQLLFAFSEAGELTDSQYRSSTLFASGPKYLPLPPGEPRNQSQAYDRTKCITTESPSCQERARFTPACIRVSPCQLWPLPSST